MIFLLFSLFMFTLTSQVKSQCGPSQHIVELSNYKKREIHIASAGGFNSNLSCSWAVSSVEKSAHILVQIKGVKLGPDDLISIYDGHEENETFALVSNFTDRSGRTDVKDARSGKALVLFTSGEEKHKGERGFTIFLLAITTPKPILECKNKTLIATLDAQYITSPGFPEGYPTNTICYWTIQALSKLHSIHLEFLFADIEEGNEDCSYDYVKAYTESNNGMTSNIFTRCTRDQWDNKVFTIPEKEVFLEFFSDLSETRAGFLLRFSSVRNSKAVKRKKQKSKKEARSKKTGVTAKLSASTVPPTTTPSDIVPTYSRADMFTLPSISFPPCDMCCTYSGVDCFQDCTLCHRPPWDIFLNPDVMNFNYNLWQG
ncbi:uncharacterized protein [Argopecten irradians]|uniref:uncharacterized protein n=1 Tax=Argopecten irradians TaxID=31199 RepID=UPI00371A2C9A